MIQREQPAPDVVGYTDNALQGLAVLRKGPTIHIGHIPSKPSGKPHEEIALSGPNELAVLISLLLNAYANWTTDTN